MARNARFHVWAHGGWVKVTVRNGQTLSWGYASTHDEGWSSYHESWENEGGILRSETFSDGTDCDGRMSQHGEYHCEVSKIHADTDCNGTPILRVPWEHGRGWQQDYSAEAMGY